MSANPESLDAVTEELKRVRRLARMALGVAAISTTVAVAAIGTVGAVAALAQQGSPAPIPTPPPSTAQAPPSTEAPVPQRIAPVVEAERFVVRDKTGRPLAELGAEADGGVRLRLGAPGGRNWVGLWSGASGTGVMLIDQGGGTATIRFADSGDPYLHLGHGEGAILLEMTKDGPLLRLSDKKALRISLGFSPGATEPALSLWDQKGMAGAVLGSMIFGLFDKEGKMIFHAP
jgi:hypothetical protein